MKKKWNSKRVLLYLCLSALLIVAGWFYYSSRSNVPIKYYEYSGFNWMLGPEKEPDRIDKEVGSLMRSQLESTALKRGDSWFLYVLTVDKKKDLFLVQVNIDHIVVIASKIRDDERRNGKEWAGQVGIHALSYRTFDQEKGLWSNWADSEGRYPFDYSDIEKAKGKWDRGFDQLDGSFNFGFSRFSFRKPKPEEIPKQ